MSDGQLHVVEIVALLRELTAKLVNSDELEDALGVLVRTTAQVVQGPAWCGITLVRAGAPTTAAVSAKLPDGVDEFQDPDGDGPCMTAIRSRDMIYTQDLADDSRWPRWQEKAAVAGIKSVLAVPLDIDEHVVGVLCVYSADGYAFSPDVQLAVMLIAEHACLLLAAVIDRSRLASLATELTNALASGETVNRAIGIVMAQRACTAEEALDVLHQASGNLHVPLEEVAKRLVTTIANRG